MPPTPWSSARRTTYFTRLLSPHGERPEDEAEPALRVRLAGVRQDQGREHVPRRRAQVAVDDAEGLVRSPAAPAATS